MSDLRREAEALVRQIVDDCADREGSLVHAETGIALIEAFAKVQRREVWEEAAKLANEQSPHHMECALKWARKCEQRKKELE